MTTPIEAADAPERITLLGSEMFTWSDLDSERGPATGPILEEFLRAHLAQQRPESVLVVGVNSPDVIALLARSATTVEVHVRSLPDAQVLREKVPDQNLMFHCGAITALSASDGYDLVIAVDGLGRVASTEEKPAGWEATLREMSQRVRDGGRLLLAVGNDIGVDRILAAAPEALDRDDAWPIGRIVDDAAPRGLARTREVLSALDGVTDVAAWAGFGRRTAPSLLVPERVVTDLVDDPRLGTLIERAAGEVDRGHVVTRDPGVVARTMLAHGRGMDAAPIWLFAASSGGHAASEASLIALTAAPAVATVIDPDGWVRRPADGATGVSIGGAAVVAEPDRLRGVLPAGPLLADELAKCCAVQDMSAVGALVRRYRDWLSGDAVDPEKTAVTLDNLVIGNDGPVPFDTHQRAEIDAGPVVVLTRSLLVFARSYLGSGAPSPWPTTYGPDEAVRSLVAAADVELTEADLDAAKALDEKIGFPRSDAEVPAYADALAELERLRKRAEEAEAQLEWLVVNIHARQRTSRALRSQIWHLKRSREYKVGARVLRARSRAGQLRRKVRVKLGLEEAPNAVPEGEWRDAPVNERDPIPVEQELLPPGFTTKGPTV